MSNKSEKRSWRRKLRQNDKMFCFVYGLYDADGQLRYIGQTRQLLSERLKWFYRNIRRRGATTRALKWIEKCQIEGKKIEIRAIDTNAIWDVSEVIYIHRAREMGIPLLNVLAGGNDSPKARLRNQMPGLNPL